MMLHAVRILEVVTAMLVSAGADTDTRLHRTSRDRSLFHSRAQAHEAVIGRANVETLAGKCVHLLGRRNEAQGRPIILQVYVHRHRLLRVGAKRLCA